jgi:hypothetical protein
MRTHAPHRIFALLCLGLLATLIGAGPAGAVSREVRSTAHTNVNRSASKNSNVNRNTNVNVNRDVNVNRNVNVNRDVNVNRHVNVDVDYHRDYDVGRAVATTAAVVATAAVVGSIARSLPPSCSAVVVNGVTYQNCGSSWYQPQYAGTSVQYVVVNAPR